MAKTSGTIRKPVSNGRRLFQVKNFAKGDMANITEKDMDSINAVFSRAFANAGIKPDTEEIYLSRSGSISLTDRKNLEFGISYDGQDKSMTHDIFIIHNAKLRGVGLSREIYKTLLPIYDKIGLKTIRVHAGDNNGGYTWARFGFVASRGEAIGAIGRISDANLQDKADRILERFYKTHSHDTKFPMHLIADQSWGRAALSGTKWRGEIDLSNSSQRKRYVDYINGRI